ncbi:hypothetical protein CH253_29365 [Rhodococcus sp. 06-156-3C]|uniref:PhnD/SsuA/transferrin family substrate-binding protein n=1 Tax=Nocardiaceae TaxID=85025 RepID=UPI000522F1E7|nr:MULTISPECIES: hypothetical protein [Rhodococcus]OZC78551.1 hypothetical protein CH282_22580 [Rhodococcus sp. 06-418-1B]OZD10848.1 hypothetical protein CH280_21595 [Rhodococcus sp. 06-156-4C]OZD11492.1 hypothetical protein CH253_29365 [Rhodococcus sp. 06-156-3C]OZD13727.1 hypothetical protein CH248_26870 [Rhodococcus sp. 06-156-4a]OZD28127.1 hypothetical protein CH247_20290 [Rhodococcus sp. 06-156-3b]
MTLTFVARHWDHLLPLALGDVTAEGVDLHFERRDSTPNIYAEPRIDVAETSFSQYVQHRARGDHSVTALPVFVMQGFRHRCIITRSDSPLHSLTQLRGATVGLTGWPDSGNTWTRALVRDEGVALEDIDWRVGPLTPAHPAHDRIGPTRPGPHVQHLDHGDTLVGGLSDKSLDAVMTPFMPPGFDAADSLLRPLLPDVRAAETAYYLRVGYVPGIHVLAARTALLDESPDTVLAVVRAIEDSKRLSILRHNKLADVTPWLVDELRTTERVFGRDWMPYGLEQNRTMISDFLTEHYEQGLLDTPADVDALFPTDIDAVVAS